MKKSIKLIHSRILITGIKFQNNAIILDLWCSWINHNYAYISLNDQHIVWSVIKTHIFSFGDLLTPLDVLFSLFTFIGCPEYLESVEHQTCTRRSAGNPVDLVYHWPCNMETVVLLYTERRQKLPELQPCRPLPVIHKN